MAWVVGSLLYQASCKSLSVPAVLVRSQAAKDAELLVLWHGSTAMLRGVSCPRDITNAWDRIP
jgi:putative transposase